MGCPNVVSQVRRPANPMTIVGAVGLLSVTLVAAAAWLPMADAAEPDAATIVEEERQSRLVKTHIPIWRAIDRVDEQRLDVRPMVDALESRVSNAEMRISAAETRVFGAEAALEEHVQFEEPDQRQSDGLGTIGTLALAALSAVGGACLAAWAFRRDWTRRRRRRNERDADRPDEPTESGSEAKTESTPTEGETQMFKDLGTRSTGITGNTGYAVIDADNPKFVDELREALRRIDDGEVKGRFRIQLRGGNHEAVATGMDTYGDVDEAFEQLGNVHDDTIEGEVARIDDSGKG